MKIQSSDIEGVGGVRRRLRVALCYTGCHTRGGVERVVLESARHLRKHCAVTVMAQSLPEEVAMDAGISWERLGGIQYPLGFGLPATRRRTEQRLRGTGVDVVAGFGVQAPPDSVVWVQSVHGAWIEQSRARRRGIKRWMQELNPFHRVVLRMEEALFSRRGFRRLIALTGEVKCDLVRLYGVKPQDVEVLPNGFRREEFSPSLALAHRRQLRAKLGIPETAWVALFVANEWERKGLMPLLDAIARMKDSSAHLVAVGRLPAPLINARAARLGLGGRVHVVGPTGRVNRWFGMADAFVLPTFYEAWGMVIVEALASGLPVVSSRGAGASEAVHEGRSGYLLDCPEDPSEVHAALVRVRNGVEWSADVIASSVDNYRWSQILSKYEEVLRSSV